MTLGHVGADWLLAVIGLVIVTVLSELFKLPPGE